MGAPTGNWLYDSGRDITEMISMQFAVYGLRNPYTYQRPKITPLPNETGLTVPGGTGVAVVPNGTAPVLNPPYLPGRYTEYPAAVQGWAQQALPGGGSAIEGGLSTQGYSNFADGMLPEDATRYILNNEKAFFNEFSERASAVGLSDTQIAEAFEAMKNGDYAKMATYFDTSSPVDGAVFWSGNKEGAAAYANSIGGTIMEQTPGGQVFDNWRGLGGMYPEWDTPTNLAQKPIWDALSSQYANGAEGIATYAHPDGYVGKVWSNIEKPILEENDIIIQEVIIDAK